MSSKKNGRNSLSNVVRAGIASLCIYLTASSLGNQETKNFILRNIEKAEILSHETSFMLDQVEEKTGIETEGNDDFTIFYAVMDNPYLSDDEKELLYSLSDLIRDNPNINKKNTYYTLKNLKIEYFEQNPNYDETIKGIFINEKSTIQIFEPKETVQKEIIIHELIHSIFNNKEITVLPEYLIEGVTELLTNEYFSKTPYMEGNTYPFEIAMTKILCEMTSPAEVLKAYTIGNMDSIYQEISSVMGIKSTSDFSKNINKMFDEYKNNKRVNENTLSEILLFMDSFFNYKYEQTRDTTILDFYFYNKEILQLMSEEDSYKKYCDYLIEKGVYQKAYFSKNLIDQTTKVDRLNVDGSPKNNEEYQYFYANERLN